jgi:hypothetical protein
VGDKKRRNALIQLLLIFGLMGTAAVGGVWLMMAGMQAPRPEAVAQVPPTVTPTPTATATATRAGLVVVTRPPTATPLPSATPTGLSAARRPRLARPAPVADNFSIRSRQHLHT